MTSVRSSRRMTEIAKRAEMAVLLQVLRCCSWENYSRAEEIMRGILSHVLKKRAGPRPLEMPPPKTTAKTWIAIDDVADVQRAVGWFATGHAPQGV